MKLTAIIALQSMGREAVAESEAELRKLAESNTEPGEVAERAKAALQQIAN